MVVVLVLLGTACIDRINLDIPREAAYPVVIDGFISDLSGPYQITVTRAYDIESKSSPRTRIAVKHLILSDDTGTEEELFQVSQGIYQTAGLIQGEVGRVYKLYIQLLDGREYESTSDTLHPTGNVDSVYFKFRADPTVHYTTDYGFDVFFNASAGARQNYQFLWKFVGTYKVNIGCCTCWSYLYNPIPIVSDGQLVQSGQFLSVKAAYVPVTGWTFMHKVHAEVNQMSLSRNAFEFWRAVKAQQEAIGSLFQPMTGKIPNNFHQLSGAPGDMFGLFFATSISSNAVYIRRGDVPNQNFIPNLQLAPPGGNYQGPAACIEQFPGSTDVKPPYWID